MEQNEEFIRKLACLQCRRRVKNKRNSYRLHSQANGFLFHYRCVRCHSEYRAVVSGEVVLRLEELGITSQPAAQVDVLTNWTYFTMPKFHRHRKERREMKKYRRTFKKLLRSKENDCLSRVAAEEGMNRKS